jgi:hypothetical protein
MSKNIITNKVESIIIYIENEIKKDEVEAMRSLKEKRFAANVMFECRMAQLRNLKSFIENLN